MTPPALRLTRARRGVSAMVVLLVLPVLLAFLVFVVDIGYARVVQAQLQAAADAAAWAGAAELDDTADGVARAEAVARFVAGLNDAHGQPVDVQAEDVDIGHWDPATGAFVVTDDPAVADAVRVRARVEDLPPLFRQVVFDGDWIDAGVIAVAARGRDVGAGSVPWYLPFALPQCAVESHSEEELMDMDFRLSPAGEDNTGWGLIGAVTNAANVQEHIDGMVPCMEAWVGELPMPEGCAPGAINLTVDLNNGVAASALNALNAAMASGIPWDEEVWGELPAQDPFSTVPAGAYGNMLLGPIPLFDGGDAYCDGDASWTADHRVTGFVWGAIYDVRAKGSAAERDVKIRIDVRHVYEVGESWGGSEWGVTYPGPSVMVQ